jgi:hypothetical protein
VAALSQEPGVDVEAVDGKRGELTVLVDGQVVARKWLFLNPSVRKVLRAVREAGQSTTQIKG